MTTKQYYISCIDGRKKYLMAGPYAQHETALANVEAVRKMAIAQNPRAHFMAFGTAGSVDTHKTPLGAEFTRNGDNMMTDLLHITATPSQADHNAITALTDMNDHTGALIKIAEIFGMSGAKNRLLAIAEIHENKGYMPDAQYCERYELSKTMLNMIKKYRGTEIYKSIYYCL